MASKRNSEQPKVMMERFLEGWRPLTGYDAERLMGYGVGSVAEVQFWRERSIPQLRLYWVVLHICVENSDSRYGTAEDLHDMLKIAMGYSRRIPLLGSNTETLVLPGSIAFNKMDQADFNIFFEKAMTQLAGAGYPIDGILQEAEKTIGRKQ